MKKLIAMFLVLVMTATLSPVSAKAINERSLNAKDAQSISVDFYSEGVYIEIENYEEYYDADEFMCFEWECTDEDIIYLDQEDEEGYGAYAVPCEVGVATVTAIACMDDGDIEVGKWIITVEDSMAFEISGDTYIDERQIDSFIKKPKYYFYAEPGDEIVLNTVGNIIPSISMVSEDEEDYEFGPQGNYHCYVEKSGRYKIDINIANYHGVDDGTAVPYTLTFERLKSLGKTKQTISVKNNIKKTIGDKEFQLNAVASNDGKISYKLIYQFPDNAINISEDGRVTILATSRAEILVSAEGTETATGAEKIVNINVRPEKIRNFSAKAGKGKMNLKWRTLKYKKNVGFEIQYSTKRNFKRSNWVMINKGNAVKKTIKKLKKGKTYYVRMRTTVTGFQGGIDGVWSPVKKVKIK